LSRPANENYFRGADNSERIRQWRKDHPGYWRKKIPANQGTLQELSSERPDPQIVDKETVERCRMPGTLQDLCRDLCLSQPALFVGLISTLTGHALQDDIAMSVRAFSDLGEDILRAGPGRPAVTS